MNARRSSSSPDAPPRVGVTRWLRRIVATTGDLGDNLARFRRSLRAENVSPNTILAYCGAVERLVDFLVASDLRSDVVAIRRDHLEAFIADALDRFKPQVGDVAREPERLRGRMQAIARGGRGTVEARVPGPRRPTLYRYSS